MARRRLSAKVAAHALEEHFTRVGRTEMARLKHKLAALNAEERVAAEAVIGHVVHALAARPARVLATQHEPRLVDAVVRLFGLAAGGRAR